MSAILIAAGHERFSTLKTDSKKMKDICFCFYFLVQVGATPFTSYFHVGLHV